MKSLPLLITFFIIVSTSLIARENPFEPTQTYETEVARLIEIDEDYPYEFQEKEDQEAYEKELKRPDDVVKATKEEMHTKKSAMNKMKTKTEDMTSIKTNSSKMEPSMKITTETSSQMKPIVKKNIEKTEKTLQKNKKTKTSTREIKEVLVQSKPVEETKTITLEKAMKDLEKVVVKVPKRTDIEIHENINILPFVNIDYTNNKIEINSKYDVFRKFTLDESNKIVLDYHAKTFFLTKIKELDTEYYKKIVIGNHLKDRYFRIVIVLKNKPNKYKVTYHNNLVTVIFDKDMI